MVDNPYNNPSAEEFFAGDVLEVYADDALLIEPPPSDVFALITDGLSVNKNGTPISDGVLILDYNPSIALVQSFAPQMCLNSTLLTFWTSSIYPYGYYTGLQNHYSCQVNPPTCDLIIVGAPDVTPATDADTSDGVITINATSSNTIEYKLNEDFAYGGGQVVNTFANLLPGDYRIFLRDSANCGVNILVNVPFSNVYGAIHRLEYDGTIAPFTSKIEITKKGYSSSVSEICGQSIPFEIMLRGEGSTDKFSALLSSEAKLNLVSETDGFFADLYTNNPNLYRMSFYKDIGFGETLLWTGKVLPFIYSETIKSPPYEVTITASDGLAELKDFYLIHKDGQRFFGTDKLIKIIAYCLKQIGLNLNIRVAVNMYADTMDTASSDDPFDQAYIDYECFYLAAKEPSLEFVLQSILEPFNARIVQWNNTWNIIRVEEMGAAYDYREFDYNGDYVSNSSYDPTKPIQYPDQQGLMWESFPNLEINKGYGQVKAIYKLGLKPNIVENGDFRLKSTFNAQLNKYEFNVNTDGFTLVNPGYNITTGYEDVEQGNIAFFISGGETLITNNLAGEAYIQTETVNVKMGANNQIKISVRYKINKTSVFTATGVVGVDAPYVKLRMRVKYGSAYLQNDGTWTNTENFVVFFVTQLSEYIESEIVAYQPVASSVLPTPGFPATGMDFEIRVYHAYVYYAQFQSITDLENFPTHSGGDDIIPTGYKTELRDSFAAVSYIYYYVLEENTSSPSGYSIIRPNDYGGGNPRAWVLQGQRLNIIPYLTGQNLFTMCVDKIKANFLIGGKEPYDSIIRVANAEPLNKEVFEKELIIGSYSSLITTEVVFNFIQLGLFFPNPTPGLTLTTTNVLSADLIYAGWLRDVDGVGYESWARDGVSEANKIHAIWLLSYSAQYLRSWRLLRGSIVSPTEYFGLLNVISDVNDGSRKYIPISLTLDDLNNRTSGEFLELMGATGGSDDSGASAFTSGFTTGFGSSGFN